MDKAVRIVGIKMTIFMGIIMSFVLSLIGTFMGGHFSIKSWLISFGISLMISWAIGFIVPLKKISDSACKGCKIDPESFKGNLISGLISDLIYTPIITIVMVVVMLGNARKHAPAGKVPTVGKALPGSLLVCFLVGFVVIIIIQPLLIKLFTRKIKNQ